MFARSASGPPGGLSINTGAANIFTNTNQAPSSQPAQPSTLLGVANPPKSSFFGSPTAGVSTNTATATQPQPASSLFGSTANTSQPPQQQTGSMFGSSLTAAGKPAMSLLDSLAANRPTQSTGGGMFGSASANTTTTLQQQPPPQQQQQQPNSLAGGGLFGAAKPAQPSTGGGVFGQSTQNTGSGGGVFGGQSTQNTGGGGMFGGQIAQNSASTSQQQQPKPSGLFGATTNQQAAQPSLGLGSSMGTGLTMGQTNVQVVPGVRIDVSNLRGTTRFNDLQEDLQNQIQQIDQGIQRAISHKNELDAFMPAHGEQIEAISTDVKFVARKYAGVDSALSGDANAISLVRGMVDEDAGNAKLSFRAVDNLKLPAAYHTQGLWRSGNMAGAGGEADAEAQQDLVGFFSRAAGDMDEQLGKYTRNLSEIEGHMHGVNSSIIEQLQKIVATKNSSGGGGGGGGGVNGTEDRLAELAAVLREFEESIMQVAGKVGTVRESVTHLQLGEFMGRSNGLA